MAEYQDLVSDGLLVNDGYTLRVHAPASADSAVLNDATSSRVSTFLRESAELNDVAYERLPSKVRDSFEVNDAVHSAGHFANLASEGIRIGDGSATRLANLVADVAVLNDGVTLRVASYDADNIVIVDLGDHAQSLTTLVAEQARISDAARQVMKDLIADGVLVHAVPLQSFRPQSFAADIAELVDAAATALHALDRAADAAVLGDATTDRLHAVDRALEVVYIDDRALGGAYAGWAAPTENWAMSRLDPFPFGSLAVVDGRLLGASPDGLCLLEGDDDNGEPVRVLLQHDWMDNGSAKLKRPRYGYLNLKGVSLVAFVLGASEDGAEVEYDYPLPATTATAFVNVRVPLGRGIRSRHLRPAIDGTAGADFELNDGRAVVDELARGL